MIICKRCGEEFETGPEVGDHARDEHSNSAKKEKEFIPYRCFQCPGLFHNAREYTLHGLEHEHPDEDFWSLYHRKHDGAPSRPSEYRQAAYDRNVQMLLDSGFVPKVDEKGVTGYHFP